MLASQRSRGGGIRSLLSATLLASSMACGSRSGLNELPGAQAGAGGGAGTGGAGGAGGIAASLSGLRWELPCHAHVSNEVCSTDNELSLQTALKGDPATSYAVRLRIRGVLEEKSYSGGTPLGKFTLGGKPESDDWNTYAMTVSAPPQTLYLNPGVSGLYYCFLLDETVTLTMRGGAVVRLWAEVYDAQQITNRGENGSAILVPGVKPFPAAFDGQFAQVDVLDVKPI